MNRRSFIQGGSALATLALAAQDSGAASAQENAAAGQSTPFSHEWLIEEAARLAAEPYQAHEWEVPESVKSMTYDQYRDIWFNPEAVIWGDQPTQFRIDLFHLGFVYKEPVKIALVKDGLASELPFDTSLFVYGHLVEPPEDAAGMGFSGFRARYPINTPDAIQEFSVFQGASYFRAVGRDQLYGLSARGLAINTAEPEGEEFPAFRNYWIEQPPPGSGTLVVYALLDSMSATGAYRFEITPGVETMMDVDAYLFTRLETKKVGIAPLTSMFMFNAINRGGFEDYRRAVHDSDGLLMLSGAGEWIWRPLCNRKELQVSYFADTRPRGFGLMQRARRYEDFEDLEGKYDRRPSLWIEPMGDWGEGFIELVEIPTDEEINDNIVAYWRSGGPMPPGGPWRFAYRMRWTDNVRPPSELATVASSKSGLSFDHERRLFVIDFAVPEDAPEELTPEALSIEVSASAGQVVNAVVHERQPGSVIRISFELDYGSETLSELRLRLTASGKPASETWIYRWTAQ